MNAENRGDDIPELLLKLKRELEAKRDSGEIQPERAGHLESILTRLGGITASEASGDSLEDSARIRDRMAGLMAEIAPSFLQPSLPGGALPSGSRAARIIALLQRLKSHAGMEGVTSRLSQGEWTMAIDLYAGLARVTTAIQQTEGEAERLLRIERDQARTLANNVRWFARRHHATLAEPVWPSSNSPLDPNRVFFTGQANIRQVVDASCVPRHLELAVATSGSDIAAARWESLHVSSLAVFDLQPDPQVFYDLGMALAAGTELLLTAPAGTKIPFDVAQSVHFYSSEVDLSSILEDWLDECLYGVQSKVRASSGLEATAAYAQRLSGNAMASAAAASLRQSVSDPIAFRAALTALGGYLEGPARTVLYPRWPAFYPDPRNPRCFFIMPFRKELDAVYGEMAEECRRFGVEPVRGDVAAGQEILQSIWEEIGRATLVVSDFTGFNLNVCVETAMAHALGRRTILIGQPGAEANLFESIAKRRLNVYQPGTSGESSPGALIQRFLKGAKVMFCGHCGSPLDQSHNFCPRCGKPLNSAASSSQPSPAASGVIINGIALSQAEEAQMQMASGMRIPPGAYWYDPMSGAWGYQGGPTAGFTHPGIPVQGQLQADASMGNTGVFINGRQLHMQDVLGLRTFCSVVLPGRYWVDGYGNCGYEGGPAFVNLRMLAAQAAGTGGNQGGPWSVNSAFGTASGDGQGNLFFSDGKTSWSNW